MFMFGFKEQVLKNASNLYKISFVTWEIFGTEPRGFKKFTESSEKGVPRGFRGVLQIVQANSRSFLRAFRQVSLALMGIRRIHWRFNSITEVSGAF